MDKEIKHKFHDNKVLENKMKLFCIYICKNKHSNSMKKRRFQVSLAQQQIESITYASMPESEASQLSFESLESRVVV
jgi:hypothetical protein